MGFDPVFVDFDRQRPDQAQSAFLIRKDANDMGAAFEFLAKDSAGPSQEELEIG